jgi:ribosome-associated toxin RatA of RatAB toxin-antitoxin module
VTDSTRASIDIAGEPPKVMAVIADVSAYPSWSDGVRSVDVLESHGDRPSRVRFSVESGPIKDTYELAYQWDGDSQVTWHLVSAGLLRSMDGSYSLTPVGSRTLVEYSLAVELTVPMPGLLRRRAEKSIVDTALRGLKQRVEAL